MFNLRGYIIVAIIVLASVGGAQAAYFQDYCWRLSQGTPCINWTGAQYEFTGIAAPGSLTLSQIGANLGNWSHDKAGIVNLSLGQVGANLGNWSAEKSSYATTLQLSSLGNFSKNASAWASCGSGQYSRWNGTGFACYNDADTDTDTDTFNTSAQMRAAINHSGYYNISINASNVLNPPWLTSYAETDPVYVAAKPTICYTNGTGCPSFGGNSSWNESRANALYYLNTNPSGFINSTTVGYNKTSWDTAYGWGNHASAGYLTSFTEADPVALARIATMPNLTLAQIGANLGNWSAEKASYVTTASTSAWDKDASNDLTLSQVGTNVGNWSAEKASYATVVQLQAQDACSEISGCVVGAITDGNTDWDNLYGYVTLAQINTNMGNWSAEKAGYATTAYVSSVGNWTLDKAGLVNLTLAQVVANAGNWSADKASYALKSYVDTLGNWSADKPSYATVAQLQAQDACSEISGCVVGAVTAAGVPAAETDSAHDECAEISGCVLGAITDGNVAWDNSYGYVTLSQINTNMGNWSADKPHYLTHDGFSAGNITSGTIAAARLPYASTAAGWTNTTTQITTSLNVSVGSAFNLTVFNTTCSGIVGYGGAILKVGSGC